MTDGGKAVSEEETEIDIASFANYPSSRLANMFTCSHHLHLSCKQLELQHGLLALGEGPAKRAIPVLRTVHARLCLGYFLHACMCVCYWGKPS